MVYVLTKVYGVFRKEASDAIQHFINSRNIICANREITVKALQLFSSNRLDFVDNILLAYHLIQGIAIYSYDCKLMNAVNRGDTTEF